MTEKDRLVKEIRGIEAGYMLDVMTPNKTGLDFFERIADFIIAREAELRRINKNITEHRIRLCENIERLDTFNTEYHIQIEKMGDYIEELEQEIELIESENKEFSVRLEGIEVKKNYYRLLANDLKRELTTLKDILAKEEGRSDGWKQNCKEVEYKLESLIGEVKEVYAPTIKSQADDIKATKERIEKAKEEISQCRECMETECIRRAIKILNGEDK